MKAIERVLKTLNHEEPDRVPSYELVVDHIEICKHYGEDYVFQGVVKSFNDTFELCQRDVERTTQTILKATETRSYIRNTIKKQLDLYVKIGYDLAPIPLSGYIMFPTICNKDHFVDEYGRIFDLKYNPSDNMDLFYYRAGYFKNFEEFEAFPSLDPDNPRRERYFKIMKKVQEEKEGKIHIIPVIWGIFESSWQCIGFVEFSKMLTKPARIKTLIDSRGKFAFELTKRFIEWGEDSIIQLYDDLGYKGGLQVSPRFLKQFVFPWYKQICDYAHKNGVKVFLHSCGDILPVFEDLINAGFDAIHPIEPTTANPDYNIFKLKEKYGDRITLIGNVSPQDLADKDAEFIKEYTIKLIKELSPGGGYILSSGHSINPAVKIENYFAMREILERYGNYPIDL